MRLSQSVINFLKRQSFVIVSTLDENKKIHSSIKGIANIDKEGNIYIIDLYRRRTLSNLKKDPTITITAVDEKRFLGFCIKGKAKIIEKDKIEKEIIKEWDKKVIERISKRLIRNVRGQRIALFHPEASFPFPQYLILMQPEEVVNLSPKELRKS